NNAIRATVCLFIRALGFTALPGLFHIVRLAARGGGQNSPWQFCSELSKVCLRACGLCPLYPRSGHRQPRSFLRPAAVPVIDIPLVFRRAAACAVAATKDPAVQSLTRHHRAEKFFPRTETEPP